MTPAKDRFSQFDSINDAQWCLIPGGANVNGTYALPLTSFYNWKSKEEIYCESKYTHTNF